jgi:hypothetical protein
VGAIVSLLDQPSQQQHAGMVSKPGWYEGTVRDPSLALSPWPGCSPKLALEDQYPASF